MDNKNYDNSVLESLYQEFCKKFGEEEFRTARERARKKLDKQLAEMDECNIGEYDFGPPVGKEEW